MDPSRREDWQGGPGPAEQMGDDPTHSRPPGQPPFGSGPPPPQPPPSAGAPFLPPPSSFYGQNQPLPPMSSVHPHDQPHDPSGPPPQDPSRPPRNPSYSLPGIHQAGQPMAADYEREREMAEAEAHAREQDMRREYEDRARHEQREHDRREWEMRERQEREQPPPHHGHADTVQLHQPVAVAPPGGTPVHGPNGLLAGANGPQGGPPQYAMAGPPPNGEPNVQVPLFGPTHEGTPRPGQHPPHMPPQNMPAFQGTPQMQPAVPGGPPGPPGQQPILNDALSYLDQVKMQFNGQSDVYNHFLDIMKDFKSQAIDTPGVIRRVSHLFAGNSTLIQGFNTFLPQGYRIECNADGNPDGIRVLTPQGTFIDTFGHELQGQRPGDHHDGPAHYEGRPDGFYQSPNLRPEDARSHRHLSPFEGSAQRANHHSDVNAVLAAHTQQQEQRGVAQLQNAANASDHGATGIQQSISPSMQGAAQLPNGLGLGPGQPRGPVEFNHAISYVNKIKNRFTGQPEIYKNFLEILQTYQRESRPIQDVYSQVTTLFAEAPDLLRDFKQFLPEATAHANKVEGARQAVDEYQQSDLRGQERQGRATPKPEQHRLPPMGNFAPTPTASRDTKRKRGDRGGPVAAPDFAASSSRTGYGPSKRSKQAQPPPQQQIPKQQVQLDAPAVEPTLVPELPHPMEPATTTAASAEELGFFDRAKKHFGNKYTMGDWLKLCNLFSQDLIDVNTLVYRASDFIGDNPDLFNWFKNFVNYTGQNQVIDNRVRAEIGKTSLANCRSVGPSYRLLPKRDRQATCTGRDELCNSVLNDAWASHPTWASEDSGFIAHRKNVHEEGLSRIEEERHDYDHHIAVCERAIQVLEPVAQQIANTPREALPSMRLGPDFTTTNHFVFKTSLSKIYGREHATVIIDTMPDRPASVVPVILLRMRQKLEEWKMVQREWEKVWRDQTQKMFWKSLDHQGIAAKVQDKRQFQTKTLQNEIHLKQAEQRAARDKSFKFQPYQQKYTFTDKEVLFDASYLLLTYAEHQYNSDSPKIQAFIKDFIPTFFDLDVEAFSARMENVLDTTPPNEDAEDETPVSETSTQPRNTRKGNAKKSDLLRDVLDKNRKTNRGDRESSVASGSRASTPDVTSTVEEDAAEAAEAAEEEVKNLKWFNHPVDGNMKNRRNLKPDDPFKRNVYNLYATLNIFCFFRVFCMLYERLVAIKQSEKEVHEAVRRESRHKPAEDFGIIDRKPSDFFRDTSAGANYYTQILEMLEDVAKRNEAITMSQLEDVLRRYYLQKGFLLYTFDKMMSALARFVIGVFSNEPKTRCHDTINLWFKDRKKEYTTHQDEIQYRKQVEKYVKEGDLFRIGYNTTACTATIRLMKPEEDHLLTSPSKYVYLHAITPEDRWRLYVTLYEARASTEGVNLTDPEHPFHTPFLPRSIRDQEKKWAQTCRSMAEQFPDYSPQSSFLKWTWQEWRESQVDSYEDLQLRISPTDYRIWWTQDAGEEWWNAREFLRWYKEQMEGAAITADKSGSDATAKSVGGEGDEEHTETEADARFTEKFVMNNAWMAGLSKEKVDEVNKEYRVWKEGGDAGGKEKKDGDAVMAES